MKSLNVLLSFNKTEKEFHFKRDLFLQMLRGAQICKIKSLKIQTKFTLKLKLTIFFCKIKVPQKPCSFDTSTWEIKSFYRILPIGMLGQYALQQRLCLKIFLTQCRC